MRGQPGASQVVTIPADEITSMPSGLTSSPTGLLVEVLVGELWYVLNGGTPVESASHRLMEGDLLEVVWAHKLRVLSPGAETTLYVTRMDAADATRVTRASGGGGTAGPSSDINVDEWGGTNTTLGQKVMASSVPVVLASNQSAVAVSGTVSTAVADVTATGPLVLDGDVVSVALAGRQGAAFIIDAVGFTGYLLGVLSFDGGATWKGAYVAYAADPGTFFIATYSAFTGSDTLNVLTRGGATHVGVQLLSPGGGTVTATVTATMAPTLDAVPWAVFSDQLAINDPANAGVVIAGPDGDPYNASTHYRFPRVLDDTPAADDYGLVVRPVGTVTVDGTVAVSSVAGTVTVDGSGVIQPVSGTVAVSNFPATQPVSGTVTVTDGSGALTVDGTVAATQSGTWNITTVGTVTNPVTVTDGGGSLTVDGTVTTTPADPVTASGSLTATSQSVTLEIEGRQSAAVILSGTWSAALGIRASWDGGLTYQTTRVSNGAQTFSSFTADSQGNGAWQYLNIGGATHVAVVDSGHSSGTVTVNLIATMAPPSLSAAIMNEPQGPDNPGADKPALLVRLMPCFPEAGVSDSSDIPGPKMMGVARTTAPTYTTGTINPLSLTTAGAMRVDGSAVTQPTKEIRAATPSQASVADSATNVTILASNANRLGATIANDSSAALKLKLGATATATSYTVRMVQYAYYEVPFGYTGIIDGLWESDPGDGAARVTELTA